MSQSPQKNQKEDSDRYTTGLVLSGGAAHGFAHLGVLEAMRELGIRPDIISGASAGAIVGCLCADGYTPEEIVEIFDRNRLLSFVGLKLRKQGLFDISGMRKLLEKHLRSENIEDLPLPLIIAATNLQTSTTEYFRKGNLVDAVIASSSIPVLFNPVVINKQKYVDGGITDNFPVKPLRDICRTVIGVNVNPIGGFHPGDSGLVQLAVHAFHTSVYSRLAEKKKSIDYFIEPPELVDYSYTDLSAARNMMDLGYREAKKVLEEFEI